MPYIKKENREVFENVVLPGTATAGELNYLITKICQQYIVDHELNYQTLNDITGALENCKQEFYRRLVSKYEDTKIEENGDVY
jgi:hypothetical protein